MGGISPTDPPVTSLLSHQLQKAKCRCLQQQCTAELFRHYTSPLCLTCHLSSPAGQPAPKFRSFNTIGRTFHNAGISRHWKSQGLSRPQLLAGGRLGWFFTLRACLTSTVVLSALRPCDTRISDWTVRF